MNFNHHTSVFAAVLLAAASLVTFAPAADAQVLLLPTTASAAVTSGSTKTVVVASATNFVVGNDVYWDRELSEIQAVSGTTITLRRGAGGTFAAPHASGAQMFPGTPSQFFVTTPQGSCTRANELVLPRINVKEGTFSDCLGGQWVTGFRTLTPRFRVYAPEPGGTAYTSINSTGTTLANTVTYCTEVNLPTNKLLTGIAVLAGTAVATDKWLGALYDSGGTLLANSAVAGATTATASTYQVRAFTSQFYAVGPAQYFGCFQSNGTTDTARMATTGVNDNILTGSKTGGTFGTLVSITPPTGFTTAVGPYIYLY